MSLVFLRMVIRCLVRLRKGMVEGDTGTIVAEAAEVRFRSLLLFDSDCYNFDLYKPG